MGVNTGIVTNQDITEFKGAGPFRVLDVQLLGEFSTKAVYFNISGDDSAPVNGDEVVIYDLGGGFKIAFKTFDTLTPSAAAGERRIYSRDSSGVKQAEIYLKDDGKVAISISAQELKDLLGELFDEIRAIETFGSPTQHVLKTTTTAAFDTLEAKFDQLFDTL